MESLKFTLQNDGTEIHNDVVLNHPAFPLSELEYKIKFTPECTYWRLGIRLSLDETFEFYHPEHRYKNPNPDFPDIHLAVGEWDNKSWSMPQRLQLAQYNFDGDHIQSRTEKYSSNNEVTWTIKYNKQEQQFRLTYWSKGVDKITSIIKSHADFAFFKVFAWADKAAFKINGSISWERQKIGSFRFVKTRRIPVTNANLGTHSHAGLINDTELGEDLLDISKDVAAFSKIMAARSFVPPLAIALLGKWGSGKSFFMRQLIEKINQISEQDAFGIYCKGIAHIRFNAWSYIDANLWASIISKIFEGLNDYISGDNIAGQQKDKIKRELSQRLTISKEKIGSLESQKDSLEDRIQSLTSRKKFISDKLTAKISTLKKRNLFDSLKSIDESFKVRETIVASLENNPTFRASEITIQELIPDEYLNDPEIALKQLKSAQTFLTIFLSKSNWKKNFMWLAILIVIIISTPFLVTLLSAKVADTNFTIFPAVLTLLAGMKAIWNQIQLTYDKIEPIAGALWKVKVDYEKAKSEAVFVFEQEEKALRIEIDKAASEINALEQQISQTIIDVAELDYKINNALGSEALYSFIQAKSISEDYKKHLGVISMIRKDLEILNNLFTQHKVEIKKEDGSEQFRQYFERPLERIVLYIDDLDRCPASNVVQVLEAVNLLMAYPLFVVVVGVDFHWILDALKTKYAIEQPDFNPENYLEKIFQIPFRLKESPDNNIKKMLNELTIPFVEFDAETGQEPNVETTNSSDETVVTNSDTITKPLSTNNQSGYEKLQELIIPEPERLQMQYFSGMLGNNPRAIKRFLNIYRVVRTHEDLIIPHGNEKKDLFAIMFLIALSVGKNKRDYHSMVKTFKLLVNQNLLRHIDRREMLLRTIVDEPAHEEYLRHVKDKLMEFIKQDSDGIEISSISLSEIVKYAPLVNRFTYFEIQ